MIKNIYLVRHGQTYYNIYNKLQGWSNSPLTKICVEGDGGGVRILPLSTASTDSAAARFLRLKEAIVVFRGAAEVAVGVGAVAAATRLRSPTLKIRVSCCSQFKYLASFLVM